MLDYGFWRNRRILLTGHTGFKGSWLSMWLQRLGADVTGVSLPLAPSSPSLFDDARVAEGMRDIRLDVRDPGAVREVFREVRPEIVLHLAAQSLVRHGYEAPIDTFSTNVMGTVNVLDAARSCDALRAVVVVTSDKCYANREWVWGYREHDAMGGDDPYSASKGCTELVTHAYRHSYFRTGMAAVASARAGNVIGGGDWAKDRLCPDAARAWLAGLPVTLRNPDSVRPWQHVLDPLYGYLVLAQRLAQDPSSFAKGWNFGPTLEDSLPVGAVIQKLAAAWKGPAEVRIEPPATKLHEAHLLRLDPTLARVELGWKPHLRLDEALEWVAVWYREFGRGAPARELTMRDIAQYEKRLVPGVDLGSQSQAEPLPLGENV